MSRCFAFACLASSCVLSVARADWVQWPSSQGGNDHFYNAVLVPGGLTWDQAQQGAASMGGYLATLTSQPENAFVFNLVDAPAFWVSSGGHDHGPWLGGMQPPGSQEPDGGWEWVSGEPWDYTNWAAGDPNNFGGNQDRLIFFSWDLSRAATWDDLGGSELPIRGYVVESTVPAPGALAPLALLGIAARRRRRITDRQA